MHQQAARSDGSAHVCSSKDNPPSRICQINFTPPTVPVPHFPVLWYCIFNGAWLHCCVARSGFEVTETKRRFQAIVHIEAALPQCHNIDDVRPRRRISFRSIDGLCGRIAFYTSRSLLVILPKPRTHVFSFDPRLLIQNECQITTFAQSP
jgi:hypothetical protein